MTVPPERLDSWKAIAEYLGRDVATVRRWEKSAGLPVRRVAGGPGRSVFAYRSEIDEWLKRERQADVPSPAEIVAESPSQSQQDLAAPAQIAEAVPRRWNWRVAVAIVAAGIAGIAWHGRGPSADTGALNVEITPGAIVARTAAGAERWRHAFPANQRTALTEWSERLILLDGGADGVVAGTSLSFDVADATITYPGRLLWLSGTGSLERTFSFDDSLQFGTTTFTGPWAITDYRLNESHGTRRLAIAAHHNHWWPGLVTLLNDRWERTHTFVNAGWVEQLYWLSNDRLLLLGFANAMDGGMVALLDPASMSGQGPRIPEKDEFFCAGCGAQSPLRYVVLPRSEVNRVTGSTANRSRLVSTGSRLIVNTIEVPREVEPPIAIYELSPALEVLRASYGDRYWEMHRTLEASGTIDHPRERCPERDGPTHVDVWDRGTGWRTVRLRK